MIHLVIDMGENYSSKPSMLDRRAIADENRLCEKCGNSGTKIPGIIGC